MLLPELSYQPSDGRFAAGETTLGHQAVVDTFGSVVLLSGIVGIFVQTLPDKGYHILSQHRGFPAVVLTLPGNTVSVPVFLDGVIPFTTKEPSRNAKPDTFENIILRKFEKVMPMDHCDP